jgi:hypothetical protein
MGTPGRFNGGGNAHNAANRRPSEAPVMQGDGRMRQTGIIAVVVVVAGLVPVAIHGGEAAVAVIPARVLGNLWQQNDFEAISPSRGAGLFTRMFSYSVIRHGYRQ